MNVEFSNAIKYITNISVCVVFICLVYAAGFVEVSGHLEPCQTLKTGYGVYPGHSQSSFTAALGRNLCI